MKVILIKVLCLARHAYSEMSFGIWNATQTHSQSNFFYLALSQMIFSDYLWIHWWFEKCNLSFWNCMNVENSELIVMSENSELIVISQECRKFQKLKTLSELIVMKAHWTVFDTKFVLSLHSMLFIEGPFNGSLNRSFNEFLYGSSNGS